MFGAAEILLMHQLATMMNSSSPSYSSEASNPTTQQLHPNTKVMFIRVHELNGFEGDILGTEKTINAGYIRSIEEIKLKLLSRGTYQETGEIIDATRITMFDKETMTVSESADNMYWILNK